MCVCLQLDDYSQVSFLPLDVQDEDSVGDILQATDMIIQYGEDLDVRIPKVSVRVTRREEEEEREEELREGDRE